jgi:hypothetical protein
MISAPEAVAFDPADERAISQFSAGDRYTLLAIALAKRLLKGPDVKADEQLRLLEELNGLTDGRVITAGMLAVIEPMSDAEVALLDEAEADDSADDRLPPSFNLLTSSRGFRLFLKLNPSLLIALRRPARTEHTEPATSTEPPTVRIPAHKPEPAGLGQIPRQKDRPAW